MVVVMLVIIITLSAANSWCHSKFKSLQRSPAVSVVQSFTVALHHQPSDSSLTAENKVQGKSAKFGVSVPISIEVWTPFREA